VGTGGAGGAGGFGAGGGTAAAFNYTGGGGGGAGMGGAVFNDQGRLTLDDSTLSGNTAQGGFGGGHGSIICCAGGDGQGLGGAIFNLNGAIATDSATVAYNTADGGGGIYNLGYSGVDGTQCTAIHCVYAADVTLTNSIMSNSTNGSSLAVSDVVSNQPAAVSTGATDLVPSTVDVGSGPPSRNIVMSSAELGAGTITGTAPITTDPWTEPPTLSANVPSTSTPPSFTPPLTLAIDPTSSAYEAGKTTLATDERGVRLPPLGPGDIARDDDIGAYDYTLITPTLTVQSPSTEGLGSQIQARATLSGGSQTTGTVTFNLYAPGVNCTGTPFSTSSDNTLAGGTALSIPTNTFTAFGTYQWQVTYSGDNNNYPVTSSCGAATVVVGKATPMLNVNAVSTINAPLSGALYGVPFEDAASLVGYNSPTGTITFDLYGPNDPTCTGTPVFTSGAVSLVNEFAESGTFTATSTTGAGVYHWVASYSGDPDNSAVSGACGDAGQSVTVTSAPSLTVQPIPTEAPVTGSLSAEATLVGGVDGSGGAPPTGTVTFHLYGPGDDHCYNSLFTSTVPLSAAGTATSGPFTPDIYQNVYFPIGTYSWEASYSGDANNPPSVPQTCAATGQTVIVGKADPTMTGQSNPAQAAPEQAVTDTVTVGQTADPTGSVTFDLYANSSCTGSFVYTSTVYVGAGTYSSGNYIVTSGSDVGPARVGVGTYYWQASYPGDSYDNQVSTTCGAAGQTLTVTKPTPTLTISQVVPSQVVVGNPVQAQATLGANALSGRVFFEVYGPFSPGTLCDPHNLGSITLFTYAIDGNGGPNGNVDGGGTYTSGAFTPTAAGLYFWEVHYTADNTIDNSADEVCGPHGSLTVTSGGASPQSITASASTTSTGWANTSTVSPSGYSGTGAITYALDAGTNGHTSDAVCQLTGATVSATGPGTCYVSASIAADATYQSATSTDVAVTFTQAAQSITASVLPTSTTWTSTSTVSTSGSSGTGAITYALDAGTNGNTSDAVCQLAGTTVSATAPGTCYVYATIASDPNYLGATSADVAVTFTLLTQNITASANPTSTTWAGTSTVSSSGSSGSGSITYALDEGTNGHTSSPECRLTGATLSATGGGICYVDASIAADSVYASATSADVAVTFTPLGQSITALASTSSTSWANTSTLSPSAFSGAGAITYSLDSGTNGNTSDPVCQLTGSTVSATAPGTCYVYAAIASDANYQGAKSVDVAVTFTRATQSITASALPTSTAWTNSSTMSTSGSSGTGAITDALDNGTNGHTSSPACRLSGSAVSATAGGTCYVYATIAADANYLGAKSLDVAVTFTAIAQTISASAGTSSTSWANSTTLSSSGYAGAGAITYSLDKGTNGRTSSAGCHVSGSTVSATGSGTCYVYATIAGDASYLSAKSADVAVTFTQASQSIAAAASPTSTSWANTSTVSSSGSAGSGAIAYSLDKGSNGKTSSAVCSLTGVTLSATGPGTCYVYATIAPDANYTGATSADVAVTFTAVPNVSLTNEALNAPMVGLAATPDGGGYWLVGADGGVFSFGDATFHGSLGGTQLNAPIVGIAATPDGGGYWLVGADGGIFAYGDASFYGSRGGQPLNEPIVGMASSSDGRGYWLIASDGGIFAYGDAQFYGSRGGQPLNKPIVTMAATPDGGGYWLVASDGGIFSYGDAAFEGSLGGTVLDKPIVGMTRSDDGLGYWLVAADGGVFSFGDAGFYGSAAGHTGPFLGLVPEPGGQSYDVVGADGTAYHFGP
jgi:hypothetical protein